MSKEISHYHYNEQKNLTYTYFMDGSFDTAAGDIRPAKGASSPEPEFESTDTSTSGEEEVADEVDGEVEVEDEEEGEEEGEVTVEEVEEEEVE